MPILFSAVAYQKTILNKFASCDGNFEEILKMVLEKITNKNSKMTYLHGCNLFHYIMEHEYFFFCITDKMCQRSRAFLFLNEIKRQFEMNKNDFTRILANQMYCYNEDYGAITIRKGDLDELNTIGVDSSDTLIGEKLLLVNNNENLRYTTISTIEKRPEQVILTVEDSKSNIILVVTLIAVATLLMFIFNPISFVIIAFILILYSKVR